MNNKQKIALGLAGVATLGLAVVAPFTVAAAESADSGEDNFISALASKLGVDSDKVEVAVKEIREERHAEREAEISEKVAQAVKDGDLTEKQAKIIEAMHEIREEEGFVKIELDENVRDMSEDERKAFFEEKHTERQAEMISALKEKGLEVTADELEELHETLRDLDIMPGNRIMRGPGGAGRGERMMMRL